MAPAAQFEAAQPPDDAVSRVVFAPESPSRLLASSWDRHVYQYEIEAGAEPSVKLVRTFEHRAPVLDVCFGSSDNEAFSAGIDHRVMRLDLETGDQTPMSEHAAAVRCVVYSPTNSLLISASWDSTLHIHNTLTPQSAPLVISLPGKPHAMAASPTKVVVAMQSRLVHIYDLPSLAQHLSTSSPSSNSEAIKPWQQRESSLKFLTRAVSCMPSDAGYATSSIEGRVAVEWFEDSTESQARKYAFKCHRQAAPAEADGAAGGDIVFPVNALAFHPKHGTFASGGGDGTVALWDAEAKRRMKQYPKYPHSVASLAFSSDGAFLAVGVCPGFETGQEDYSGQGETKIFVRTLTESEAKGKGAK